MNCAYRSIWNDKTQTFVAVAENVRSAGKKSVSSVRTIAAGENLSLKTLVLSLALSFGASVYAGPVGGVVAAGSASISSTAGSTSINQSTQNAVINWQSFSISSGETVRFVQPNVSSVALNRVLGPDPSSILGGLSANGKVFLINPNGVLFGQGAQVNVGALLASTLNITDSDFLSGNYKFSGNSAASVVNQGAINADGGYVALLGANVNNQGVISARLGTVALTAGNAMTLDLAGDGLLRVQVSEGAVNALVQNGGLIRADGGQVLLNAKSAGALLQSAVNNTGVIQAQTIGNQNGRILLLGDMQNGTLNVSGTLDASAPIGGNGGFIETSAAHVNIAQGTQVTTAAPLGLIGTWLIDPQDFTIGAGGNISGATLSGLLVTNSVVISTSTGTDAAVAGTPPVSSLFTATTGNGDIFVNEAVSWTASSSATTLTLNAARDVNVNAAITATNGNLVVCCGRDVNVNAAITTTNGSVLLSAGQNVNMSAPMSTTDGNMTLSAGQNVNISSALTLTRGTSVATQSLGLTPGLVLNAGVGASGPGIGGGTVVFAPLAPVAVVTGPNAQVVINYNPSSYTTPTSYSSNFSLSLGASLVQHMLVYPGAVDKTFDGTSTASLSFLKGNPIGVSLVAGSGATANYDSAATGVGKLITYSGYTLSGPNASDYALGVPFCGPFVGRTSGNILPAIAVVPVPPIVVVPVPPIDILSPLVVGLLEEAITLPVETVPRLVRPQFLSPTWMPNVVTAGLPPELLTLAPPARPQVLLPIELPVVVPVPPQPIFVPPVRVPKQDRN